MKGLFAVALVATLFAAMSPVEAAASGGFGVSPVSLDFTDPPLLRGSLGEGSLRLQNRDTSPTHVTIVPEGALAEWISIDGPSEVTIEPGSSRSLRVRIAVPDTAPNGDHAGHLRLRARGAGEPAGSGATTQVELLPAIRVRVTGDQVVAFSLEQAHIEDPAPDTPLVLRADLLNRGNVRESAKVDLVVRARDGAEIFRETLTAPPIPPATKQRVEIASTRGLPAGLYTAIVSLPQGLGGGAPITIDLESRAGGARETAASLPTGDVVEVLVPNALAVGKLAAFGARFHNDGAVDMASAKLTVEIHRGAERVAVVTSDALRIAAGGTMLLEAFWEPTQVGEHVARAYVTYDGVRTLVRQATFLVEGEGSSEGATGSQPDSKASAIPGPGALLALAGIAGAAAFVVRRRG